MNKIDFDPREHLDAMKRKATALESTLQKFSLLADACLRRLSPADHAAVFAECRGEE